MISAVSLLYYETNTGRNKLFLPGIHFLPEPSESPEIGDFDRFICLQEWIVVYFAKKKYDRCRTGSHGQEEPATNQTRRYNV
ncbi:MAG TPA: hypothetical protein DCZ91_11845 [Lachnospiraceae bacterium]|nr:hypothetical protein [Lachnospiraceae bacterium]